MRQRFLIDSADAFPMGEGVAVTVNGKSLVIIHTAAGFFAVLNHCPHMGLSLDNGTVVGKVLVCLWHGAQFDLATGACLRWAANEPPPEAIGETRRPLITFPIIVEDGQVVVEMEVMSSE
ncbi:MAG: Rieske (2Fe-2S) protein [Anaerolineae bacterium]|nr:Rieske (2Fe-2S) protein [Anaerolineae bacterium]